MPDIYQGDELLSLSLVDPDNRRPVDWDERREALAAVKAGATEPRKLWLIHTALAAARRRIPTRSPAPTSRSRRARTRSRSRAGERSSPPRSCAATAPICSRSRGPGTTRSRDRELSGRISVADLTGELGIALLHRA